MVIIMEDTATQNKNPLVRLIEKAYGGLDMSWRNVILFAVGTAVLTAIFMIVPIFKDTSFERMGISFESWIFFAVIIMANCYRQEDTKNGSFFDKFRQPLICAAKVFVFFLISQPISLKCRSRRWAGSCSGIIPTGSSGRWRPFPWRSSAGTSIRRTGSV